MNYETFLRAKFRAHESSGLDGVSLPSSMFDFQRDLTGWALRKGRASIFADTGLGKSRMQLAWADAVHRETGHDVLILAPLAVAPQTVAEGSAIGVKVRHVRSSADVEAGISIVNYDRLHLMDCSRFGAIVLDESSIIKHHTSKTLQTLLDSFRTTPYKLCATATPAPNDWTELGTHAEFLGVCTRSEMLSEFFVHDGGETQVWRLKGHARGQFWRWVSSWGALVRKPSDIGFDDSRFVLPPLETFTHCIEVETEATDGRLFALEASSLMERRQARKGSLSARVEACAAKVASEPGPWLIWCELNAEGDALRQSIPGAVEIRGSDDTDVKESRLMDFAAGRIPCLISKPSICGWGLNFQVCSRMAFVGVNDSYESYYQAVRRCWRFGQTKPVQVHLFYSAMEGPVLQNIRKKEAEALAMGEALSAETSEAVKSEVMGQARVSNDYRPKARVAPPEWLA